MHILSDILWIDIRIFISMWLLSGFLFQNVWGLKCWSVKTRNYIAWKRAMQSKSSNQHVADCSPLLVCSRSMCVLVSEVMWSLETEQYLTSIHEADCCRYWSDHHRFSLLSSPSDVLVAHFTSNRHISIHPLYNINFWGYFLCLIL